MFGKTKRYAALAGMAIMLSGCGAVQNGSILDSQFWERSPLAPESRSETATDRGLAELVRGNFLPAEAHFDTALQGNPQNVYALLGKAMVYQSTGQATRARSHYEAVLALRPDAGMSFLVWTDSTPRPVSEVASVNLSLIDSGSVVGNLATGAAGVDVPPEFGGQPGAGLSGSAGSGFGMQLPRGQAALRQTEVGGSSNFIPEMGLDEGDRNIVSRFTTLRDLLDQGLITPEEYNMRRAKNVGALVPLTSEPPSAGLDRPVPSSQMVSGRLRAIGRALEMRAITIEQHAAERKMILDALMPDKPLVLDSPGVPPSGLMASADEVRRLEGLRNEGLISSDEYARERASIEKGLQGSVPGVQGSMRAPSSGGQSPMSLNRGGLQTGSGPQPAVHLASYKSRQDATRGWTQLQRTHRNVLGSLRSEVTEVNLGPGKGVFYRLLAGPFNDRSSATAACRELKSKRQFCEPGFMGTSG